MEGFVALTYVNSLSDFLLTNFLRENILTVKTRMVMIQMKTTKKKMMMMQMIRMMREEMRISQVKVRKRQILRMILRLTVQEGVMGMKTTMMVMRMTMMMMMVEKMRKRKRKKMKKRRKTKMRLHSLLLRRGSEIIVVGTVSPFPPL